jgi:dihydrofolate reductase
MSKVIFDISMSLDGFMTAAKAHPGDAMGDGGLQLVDWAFGEDAQSRQVLQDGIAGLGAVIAGRRTYDDSVPYWGADGPSGNARRPVFVVSHSVPREVPEDGVYTFVTGGIGEALQMAKRAAGDKYVTVMGGADIGQQFIRAGLVDEISIHLVPVIFGSGTRMFDHTGDQHIQLETLQVIQTSPATHFRFRVIK